MLLHAGGGAQLHGVTALACARLDHLLRAGKPAHVNSQSQGKSLPWT